jgi:hypothetical protein
LNKIKNFPKPKDEYRRAVMEVVDLDQVPTLLGGTNPAPCHESPEELEMRAWAQEVCRRNGVPMAVHP